MKRRGVIAASALTLCAVLAMMGGGPVSAEPTKPGGPDGTDDVLKMFTPEQRDRMEVVAPLSDEILRLAGSTDDWRPGQERPVDGYLLTVLGDRTLDVYWKGELPSEVKAVIKQHPLVKVTVHQVTFDEDEYLGAQKLVVDRLIADPPAGARYDAVMHADDRSSLTFVLMGSMDSDGIAAVEELIASWIDIPFTVEVVKEPTAIAAATRQNDASPWKRGAQISIAGGWCTTGFPVTMEDTGNKYLTTARHCITEVDGSYVGASGDVDDADGDALGIWKNTGAWNRPEYDVTLVKPNSGSIGSSVYSGGINSSALVTLSGAKSSPDPGGYVWGSGANSGAHVLQVVSKNAGYSVNSTPVTGGHVLATASGGVAVAQGDSGGPAMRVVSNNDYGVGTISAFPTAYQIACPTLAHNPGGNVKCGSRVWYTSLTGTLASFNARVGN